MRTRCLTRECPLEAQYVIIYGCLEGHIYERPLCSQHSEEWLRVYDNRKWACPCREKIADIRLCLAEEVTVEWLNI